MPSTLLDVSVLVLTDDLRRSVTDCATYRKSLASAQGR